MKNCILLFTYVKSIDIGKYNMILLLQERWCEYDRFLLPTKAKDG